MAAKITFLLIFAGVNLVKDAVCLFGNIKVVTRQQQKITFLPYFNR